jgi:hypothetical protein
MHRSRETAFSSAQREASHATEHPSELLMVQRLASIYSTLWRAVVLILTVEISVVSVLRYLAAIEPPPAPVAANAFADPFLVLHVVGGVTALLVAPLQFVRTIRARWPRVHRATGGLYLLGCAIGATTGFVLALGTTAGPVAAVGFAISALLWPAFSWLGWRAAVERRLHEHREWMLRSHAIAANAITLRVMLPASALLGFDFFTAYPVIAWLGWLTNLALFEYWIRRSRYRTAISRQPLAA